MALCGMLIAMPNPQSYNFKNKTTPMTYLLAKNIISRNTGIHRGITNRLNILVLEKNLLKNQKIKISNNQGKRVVELFQVNGRPTYQLRK